ncbi:Transposase [Lactiplantibacillus plantarum]|nr:Transposase [Lactiplantibacillus plantarum]VDH10815.1 Transposase [Lactiplantibacillus plantarum]
MNELTTEIIAALAQKQDLDEVFRHHLEIAMAGLKIIPCQPTVGTVII